jgi:protocatechuate 3,4-dioxygenase beta subunit
VRVRPGAKVVFWAAEPANEDLMNVNDYRAAYLEYRNAGVATADADGNATLKVRTPQGYTVPMKGQLPPHIHYRECAERGMMKPIVTVTLDGKEYFTNPVEREESPETIKDASDFAYVQPSTALEEINRTARKTAADSLMPESGAPVEWPPAEGAGLDAAFGPLMNSDLPTLTGSTPTGDYIPQRN